MKILAAIDFSDATDPVLLLAQQYARAFDAEVAVVHVAEPDPAFVGYEAGPAAVRTNIADTLRHEHRRIQEKAEHLRSQGTNATALLIQGPTVRTLLDEADRLECDLIITGSHGHGAMYNLLMGSVSEGLLKDAKCPVLVVPAGKNHAKE